MVVHLFLNNNKDLDLLPINSIKNGGVTVVRKLLNAEKEAERKARTRHLIQLGALFEIANLDKRDPAELLGILLKTAEIDPNDMQWQIWKDLGQEVLNQRKKTEKQSN